MGFNPVENFLTWLSQGGGDSMGFTGSLAQNLPVNQIEQQSRTGPPAYDRNLPIRDESPLYDDYAGGDMQQIPVGEKVYGRPKFGEPGGTFWQKLGQGTKKAAMKGGENLLAAALGGDGERDITLAEDLPPGIDYDDIDNLDIMSRIQLNPILNTAMESETGFLASLMDSLRRK